MDLLDAVKLLTEGKLKFAEAIWVVNKIEAENKELRGQSECASHNARKYADDCVVLEAKVKDYEEALGFYDKMEPLDSKDFGSQQVLFHVGEKAREVLKKHSTNTAPLEKSTMRLNAEKDPDYCPYCLLCSGLVRMKKVEDFYWKCHCGAKHDERIEL